MNRKGFKDLLNSAPEPENDLLADMHDGEFYQTFKYDDGSLYFQKPHNLGLIMNVDPFQPYKNSEYSLGAIYMAISNLPRDERFKWDNKILCGIIPGPKEPKYDINTYLQPIVNELLEEWSAFFSK